MSASTTPTVVVPLLEDEDGAPFPEFAQLVHAAAVVEAVNVERARIVERIRALHAFTVDDGANEVDVVHAADLFTILDELGGDQG